MSSIKCSVSSVSVLLQQVHVTFLRAHNYLTAIRGYYGHSFPGQSMFAARSEPPPKLPQPKVVTHTASDLHNHETAWAGDIRNRERRPRSTIRGTASA